MSVKVHFISCVSFPVKLLDVIKDRQGLGQRQGRESEHEQMKADK